jgi:hypothetical protein
MNLDDVPAVRQREVSLPDPKDPLALRREDLAGIAAAYLRELRGRKMWAWVGSGFAGMALCTLLISVAERRGWPSWFQPGFFFLGWACFLGSYAVIVVQGRRIRARYEIRCPECDASLLGRPNRTGGLSRADLAIATGRCPACGKEILAP